MWTVAWNCKARVIFAKKDFILRIILKTYIVQFFDFLFLTLSQKLLILAKNIVFLVFFPPGQSHFDCIKWIAVILSDHVK